METDFFALKKSHSPQILVFEVRSKIGKLKGNNLKSHFVSCMVVVCRRPALY